jgi:hypothetical protein
MEEEQKTFIAEIFLWRARFLFGILLNDIFEKTDISQGRLGKAAKEYRKYLKSKGYLYSKSDTGTIDQSGISRIINVERPPGYAQIYIWLNVVRKYLESEKYRNKCRIEDIEAFQFTKELESDIYRLAFCGTPEEVVAAYKRHQHLIDEDSPEFIAAYEKHKAMLEEGDTNF